MEKEQPKEVIRNPIIYLNTSKEVFASSSGGNCGCMLPSVPTSKTTYTYDEWGDCNGSITHEFQYFVKFIHHYNNSDIYCVVWTDEPEIAKQIYKDDNGTYLETKQVCNGDYYVRGYFENVTKEDLISMGWENGI